MTHCNSKLQQPSQIHRTAAHKQDRTDTASGMGPIFALTRTVPYDRDGTLLKLGTFLTILGEVLLSVTSALGAPLGRPIL